MFVSVHTPSFPSMHMALLSPRSYCTHHTTGHVWWWCILLESTHNVSVRTAQSKCTAFFLTPTILLNCPSSSLGSSWDRPPRSLPPLQRMVGLYSKYHKPVMQYSYTTHKVLLHKKQRSVCLSVVQSVKKNPVICIGRNS